MNREQQSTLTLAQRAIDIFIIVALLLLYGFFSYHQSTNTGFFTEKFRSVEMFFFYSPLLFATVAPAVRVWSGQRNPARPLEAASSLFSAVGCLWLLVIFPFSFAHFGDTLPETLRSVVAWVTDDIAKIPLILTAIGGPISAGMTLWRYFSIRSQKSEPTFKRRTL